MNEYKTPGWIDKAYSDEYKALPLIDVEEFSYYEEIALDEIIVVEIDKRRLTERQ